MVVLTDVTLKYPSWNWDARSCDSPNAMLRCWVCHSELDSCPIWKWKLLRCGSVSMAAKQKVLVRQRSKRPKLSSLAKNSAKRFCHFKLENSDEFECWESAVFDWVSYWTLKPKLNSGSRLRMVKAEVARRAEAVCIWNVELRKWDAVIF